MNCLQRPVNIIHGSFVCCLYLFFLKDLKNLKDFMIYHYRNMSKPFKYFKIKLYLKTFT